MKDVFAAARAFHEAYRHAKWFILAGAVLKGNRQVIVVLGFNRIPGDVPGEWQGYPVEVRYV